MRKIFTSFILLLIFPAIFVNAQEWNISTDDFNALGEITETTTVNGLTIYAHSEKTVTIDANNKSLDGMEFTHRLKLGGSGDFDDDGLPLGRVLAFDVSSNAKITVMGMSSSSSEDRQLHLAAGHEDEIFATFPALGEEISKGEYDYTGEATTIYLYSPSSGVNIYYLKVEEGEEEPPAEGEWNISTDAFNALGEISETTTVNGLTIYAHSEKTVTIDANNKSLDGMEFTHRLKLGGSGDFDDDGLPLGRVLAFDVSGNAKITVMGMSSSSSEDRQLHLAAGHEDEIFATFPALGEEISKGEYYYTGEATTIYLYSPSSGVNIYYLKVEEGEEEPPAEGEWNISLAAFNTLGDMVENTTVNGLTIHANSERNVTVDENSKELNGMEFTHRLKLNGSGKYNEDGSIIGRVLSFEVEGNTNITVIGMSSSDASNRELALAAGHPDSVFATFPALGGEISEGVYYYQGEATTIYLYSTDSGVNLYMLKAESVPTNFKPIADREDIKVYPNPATDRVFVNVNKPTQVAVFNLAGSMVKSQLVESENDFINVNDLQPGMYIIRSKMSDDFAEKLIVR